MKLRTRLIVASLLAIELIAVAQYLPTAPPEQLPILATALLTEYAIALIIGLATAGPRF